MDIRFSGDLDEAWETLNTYIHTQLGYHNENNQGEAWKSIDKSAFVLVTQAILKFQELDSSHFLAARWLEKINKFMGTHFFEPSSSSEPISTSFPISSLQFSTEKSASEPTTIPTEPIVLPIGGNVVSIGNPLVAPHYKSMPPHLRYAHSVGGSTSTRPKRRTKKKTTAELKVNSFLQACRKVGGMDQVNEIRETWSRMETGFGEIEHEQGDGVLINLISQGLSARDITALLPVGGFRCHRLKVAVDTDFVNYHTRKPKQLGSRGFTDDQIQFLKDDANSWPTEDGFPCAHRRPRTYIIEENMTWTKLHARYLEKADLAAVRKMSYARWTQDIHFYFPGLRLTRSKEDVCDACVRIETALLCINLSDAMRAKLVLEKSMHIQAAIDQRHAMSDFVKQFVKKVAPNQKIPDVILEDCIDTGKHTLAKAVLECTDLNLLPVPTVLIQCEDYGGSLALPHYGFNRPSADYFNSNLIIHQFVTANINNNTNRVSFYDERGQGKGADALCSLRIRNLLELLDVYRSQGDDVPSCLMNILDNCVGQNKSNIVFKFFAMISLLLFQKVILLYLIPGHSHMKANRVVAWCKGQIRGRNMYFPGDIADACDAVKGVSAEFLDHRDPKRPFFINWDTILDKYFKPMPIGFTGYYFYEIDEGIVSMRHLASTPEADKISVPLIPLGSAEVIRSHLLKDLFGLNSVRDLSAKSLDNLQLPRHPGILIATKKILSIAKKYSSIPAQYLEYFPSIEVCPPGELDSLDEETCCAPGSEAQVQAKGKKKKNSKDAVGARVPGRPKKAKPDLANQPSILTFLPPRKAKDKVKEGDKGKEAAV